MPQTGAVVHQGGTSRGSCCASALTLHWTLRKDDPEPTTNGGSGHYEAVVKRSTTAAGEPGYTGLYRPDDPATLAEYEQVVAVAKRLKVVVDQQKATQSMTKYYNIKHKGHQFQMLDSVGVRVAGKNPRKGDTANTLPGLVIGVHPHEARHGRTKVMTHLLYTVWSQYGVAHAEGQGGQDGVADDRQLPRAARFPRRDADGARAAVSERRQLPGAAEGHGTQHQEAHPRGGVEGSRGCS